MSGGRSIVGVSAFSASALRSSVAAASSSSELASSNGLATASSTRGAEGRWWLLGAPNEDATTLAIASAPPPDAKSGTDSGSSRKEKLPPAPSSMNAVFIAGRARASANAPRSASWSRDKHRARSASRPPGGAAATVAATYTVAPCNKCASTATRTPTCATSLCHCSAARGGLRGSAALTTSSVSRSARPSASIASRLFMSYAHFFS